MDQGGRREDRRGKRSDGEALERMSWRRSVVGISGGVWDQGGGEE